jgi:mono/diheme cytochrome c family protein
MNRAAPVMLAALAAAAPAAAGDRAGDIYRGAGIALHWCAACHVVDARDTGPALAGPPPFPEIAAKPYATAGFLRQRLSAEHTRMPKMQLRDRDKDDVIAYIRSLRMPGNGR